MSSPFVSQIAIVGFNFAPRGWAVCNGQLMPIAQNTALFVLLGTTYGGDGQVTFALPDLRGRVPVHFGQGVGLPAVTQGERGGEEHHTVFFGELPAHTHVVVGTPNQASSTSPVGNVLAEKARRGKNVYAPSPGAGEEQRLDLSSVSQTGGGQPHSNMQPSVALNFIIALEGFFPSRN